MEILIFSIIVILLLSNPRFIAWEYYCGKYQLDVAADGKLVYRSSGIPYSGVVNAGFHYKKWTTGYSAVVGLNADSNKFIIVFILGEPATGLLPFKRKNGVGDNHILSQKEATHQWREYGYFYLDYQEIES